MQTRSAVLLLPLLLAACTDSNGTSRTGRCLYAVQLEYGRMMKWDSCTQPPPNAVQCFNCESR